MTLSVPIHLLLLPESDAAAAEVASASLSTWPGGVLLADWSTGVVVAPEELGDAA